MISDVHRALYAFWSSFGIPAFLSGKVPDNTTFPYITFEVLDGESLSKNVLTAFVWCKAESGENVNAQRASYLDRIAEAIPENGAVVYLREGMLALYRNESGFLSYYDDPNDGSVVGGRVSYQVNFYHN